MTASNGVRLAALSVLCLLPALALAGDAAQLWLERMNRALHSLDYEGRFAYQHGDALEAMYVAHTVRDGGERQHLVSLTGQAREVIRDPHAVICIIPGNDATKIDKRPTGRGLASIRSVRPATLSEHYRFKLDGTERVAGRHVQVVLIEPRDDLRYGYRLSLDQEHALPLAASVLDQQGKAVSRLLFTDIKIGEEVTARPPALATKGEFTRQVQPVPALQKSLVPRWRFADTPPGFALSMHRRRLVGQDERELEHFVFSDGLASVSVYVEEHGSNDAFDGATRHGAIIALGRPLKDHQATAVGEVPQRTLERFLSGLEPDRSAP